MILLTWIMLVITSNSCTFREVSKSLQPGTVEPTKEWGQTLATEYENRKIKNIVVDGSIRVTNCSIRVS